jgi:hypothetical protein
MKVAIFAFVVVIDTDEPETTTSDLTPKPSPLEQLLSQLSYEPEEEKGTLNGTNVA